jgi:hypothetical protein
MTERTEKVSFKGGERMTFPRYLGLARASYTRMGGANFLQFSQIVVLVAELDDHSGYRTVSP